MFDWLFGLGPTMFLSPDDGGGNGGGDGGNGDGSNAGGDNAGNQNQQPKTFTQAEVDAIVAKRLEREKAKAEEEKRKAALTESERLQAEKVEAEKRAQDAVTTANARLISAEVKLACAELGVIDPDAVQALMDRNGIEVDDQGTVKGVKGAVEALLTAKPYLKGNAAPAKSGGDFSSGNGSNQPKSLAEALAAHFRR